MERGEGCAIIILPPDFGGFSESAFPCDASRIDDPDSHSGCSGHIRAHQTPQSGAIDESAQPFCRDGSRILGVILIVAQDGSGQRHSIARLPREPAPFMRVLRAEPDCTLCHNYFPTRFWRLLTTSPECHVLEVEGSHRLICCFAVGGLTREVFGKTSSRSTDSRLLSSVFIGVSLINAALPQKH